MLSLTLAMPAMAKGPAEVNLPHWDVNFVTGQTDPSYQVLVSKTESTTIRFVFTSDVSERYISDSDGTDGYAEVWLPAGYYWELFARATGKVGTSATWYGQEFWSTRPLTWGDPIDEGLGPNGVYFDTTYEYGGCSNLGTRWVYFTPS